MSVFRASNSRSTPSNSRSTWPGTFPDGPTERLGQTATDRRPEPPRAGVALAVLLAMLALIVATAALLLAWRALDRPGPEPAAPTPVPAAVSG